MFVRPLALAGDPTEVGDNDGHRQGYHQHPTQGAQTPDQPPGYGAWHYVAVAIKYIGM